MSSFIESGYKTKVEYEAALASGAIGSGGGKIIVYYWPMLGRAGPVIRMLEHTQTPYEHRGPPDLMAMCSAMAGTGDTFAPPVVVDGDYAISQSVACALYIGKRVGLTPKGYDEFKAVQYMNDIVDTFDNGFAKNNEDGPTLKKFLTGERWPKLMGNIERAIKGPYYFGAQPCCVDFFLCHVIDWRNVGTFDRLSKQTGVDYWAPYPKVATACAAIRAFPAYQKFAGVILLPNFTTKDEVFENYDQ